MTIRKETHALRENREDVKSHYIVGRKHRTLAKYPTIIAFQSIISSSPGGAPC